MMIAPPRRLAEPAASGLRAGPEQALRRKNCEWASWESIRRCQSDHYRCGLCAAVEAGRIFLSSLLRIILPFPPHGFRDVGGFRESFWTSEDREFCDRWTHQGRELAYLPDAVVYHSHSLDFPGLMRQHFNYGRGASRFHRLRAQRGWGRFHFYGRFYSALLQQCRGRRFTEGLLLAILLAGTQLAAAAGFVRESVARRPRILSL